MTMRKAAQRIPFKPSKTQALLLERCFGERRFAYNQQVGGRSTRMTRSPIRNRRIRM